MISKPCLRCSRELRGKGRGFNRKLYCAPCKAVVRKETRAEHHRQNKYGLTLAEYDAARAVAAQQPCRLCEKRRPLEDFVLDHCHATGKLRGFICGHCNVKLGWLEKNGERIKSWLGAV